MKIAIQDHKTHADITKPSQKHIYGEKGFQLLLLSIGLGMVLLLVMIFLTLLLQSGVSIKHFGLGFINSSTWNPVSEVYGALPFLLGTILTSFLAILISTPFSLAIAIYLGEFFKRGFIPSTIRSVIELLAGVPSVIYGLWGIFFLVPLAQQFEMKLGLLPDGVGIFTAALILSIMIIPYSASVAREVISMVPGDLKQAAYSLGATRYEVIRDVVLPYAKSGILAGLVLALGRALGETMAVTMVIGNNNSLPEMLIIDNEGILGKMLSWGAGFSNLLCGFSKLIASLFSGSNTMASLIANEFSEASDDLHLSSLVQIGLQHHLVTR